ncbi:MAG TPA: TPM domain-containing protein [Ottowia sp.]|uniref:TPM domain-containing protein n=1 Tax=Ottowia sp. TaxID=1898956 RepID=UPI002C23B523|nr:TPM domain-containing protein [Ottowia sp.]HMN22653.1 TPM domain-containing protein [Ottowia sp.]
MAEQPTRAWYATLRHLWLDERDARRAVPPALAERLRERVAASERRHSGQLRICVEGGLPPSYLWRHLRWRVPMPKLVHQRALMLFSRLHVWDTEHNNGVLIYLLLAERRIELVADRAVARRVDAQAWSALVRDLGEALHHGRFEQGLLQAVDGVTELLAPHFRPADDGPRPNELPDEPVLR